MAQCIEVACHWTWWPEFDPRTPVGKSQLPQVVLWRAHPCDTVHFHTRVNTFEKTELPTEESSRLFLPVYSHLPGYLLKLSWHVVCCLPLCFMWQEHAVCTYYVDPFSVLRMLRFIHMADYSLSLHNTLQKSRSFTAYLFSLILSFYIRKRNLQ